MWWDDQNLNTPRRDESGKRWHCRVWHEIVHVNGNVHHAARVFFWDDEEQFTGVRIFRPGDNTHVTALRDFIRKLMADSQLRVKYRRDLRFPLERHYSEYGAFPEESSD